MIFTKIFQVNNFIHNNFYEAFSCHKRQCTYKSTRNKDNTCVIHTQYTLCKKCQYSEFFWAVLLRVSLRIQSECGIIRTRKTPNMENFHALIVDPFRANVLVYFNSLCYFSVLAAESWHPLKYRSSCL